MEKGVEEGLIRIIKETFSLAETDLKTYSPLTLAFIGDVVYDLIIRTLVVEQGNAPVNKLHKRVSSLVKASAQMELYHSIEDMLTEEELSIYKRGRNAKSFTTAKNASITEYRSATGLEALIGYLYLDNRLERVLELIKAGLERRSTGAEEKKKESNTQQQEIQQNDSEERG
ncbi:Mini-ribonuclease 3 [Anaerocolumna xylanovorans]|uniref:Mini-ribonuclease 3 n=1 Tax=Anaerocolumna xylanovorans DSM 12503 TaxID=1121345 RepID=A0A1M7Y4M6_9FIRM|nr:ribonuclease III domain-containing protein [Anaerocolumna xylanovorans]SHO47204.1 ribonuclease-3 family protein [Anaerocolumna xylanovorans DSM 12503]